MKKEKQKTAVELFAQRLIQRGIGYNKMDFEEAKEMENEQHQETFKQSRSANIFEKDMPPVWESWEQYYNETFKQQEQ
jgi:hypothetical protein